MQVALLLSAECWKGWNRKNKADETKPATFLQLQRRPSLSLVLSYHLGQVLFYELEDV